ncbi:MAG: hypothetical protein AAGE88_14860 [Actinomycetota bacterium]
MVGVDMTTEMVAKARANAAVVGADNVEFCFGFLEDRRRQLTGALGSGGDRRRRQAPVGDPHRARPRLRVRGPLAGD